MTIAHKTDMTFAGVLAHAQHQLDRPGTNIVTLTGGQWAAVLAYQSAPVTRITDAHVESVGNSLWIYWNDVGKRAKAEYRRKTRAALEQAFGLAP
jgi:hypothetical protein